MASTLKSIRFPDELNAALEAEAKARGVAFSAVVIDILDRWRGGGDPIPASSPRPPTPPSFSHGRSKTVVVETKRRRVDVPESQLARAAVMAAQAELVPHVDLPVGPIRPGFGDRLKPTKGKKP